MPCSDGNYERDCFESQINELCDLLCKQCRHNEKHNYSLHPLVQNWFTKHRDRDTERKRQIEEDLKTDLEQLEKVKHMMRKYQNGPLSKFTYWQDDAKRLIKSIEYFKLKLREDFND